MKFHYIARAIVHLEGKYLLVRSIGETNTFLPGGHIELGESAHQALKRELREEFGREATVRNFIGAVEHLWPETLKDNHEINLVFNVGVDGIDVAKAPVSLEEHLEFLWVSAVELDAVNLQPYPIRKYLQEQQSQSGVLWGSSMDV